jgi:hypothetical protein
MLRLFFVNLRDLRVFVAALLTSDESRIVAAQRNAD